MRGVSSLSLSAAALLALGMAGCSGGSDSSGKAAEDVPFRSISREYFSGVETQQERVITDAAAWNAFRQGNSSLRSLPDIDFSREHVAAVFLGFRGSGGFEVQVKKVTRGRQSGSGGNSGELLIRVEESRPGEGCAVPAVVTTPAEIIAYPAQPDSPSFSYQVDIVDCE